MIFGKLLLVSPNIRAKKLMRLGRNLETFLGRAQPSSCYPEMAASVMLL
jgi:hypothetical protein